MEHKNKINFFWSGNDWTYLHDLTIKSHISVGHTPIIWIHGDHPDSEYWNFNIYNKFCSIKNADEIVDITKFIKDGGNFKTASALWRFTFLYKHGGWYSDTDAIALKKWPDGKWIVCGEKPGMLSIGVIKIPPKQKMFVDMIDCIMLEWGNVRIFNNHYHNHQGNIKETINSYLFYPIRWENWKNIISVGDIPDTFSIHLYHTMFERNDMINKLEEYLWKNQNTILSKISRRINLLF
jgi:hypothetical protein